jgi:stage V sporulation protein G
MEITVVRVFPRGADEENDRKLKAYASITFDDMFVVKGLKVIKGGNGLFVVMPGRKLADGTFKDIAHPINTGMRDIISKKVLDQFNKTSWPDEISAQGA